MHYINAHYVNNVFLYTVSPAQRTFSGQQHFAHKVHGFPLFIPLLHIFDLIVFYLSVLSDYNVCSFFGIYIFHVNIALSDSSFIQGSYDYLV